MEIEVIQVIVPPRLTLRHFPVKECDGHPYGPKCAECGAKLCSCEHAYGHDCEE